MASGAKAGLGTQLQRDDGAGNYTTIAEIISVNGPSEALETIDVTNMDSPSNYREYIATFIDGGEVSFEANFLPGNATHQGMASDLRGRTLRNFKLLFTQFSPTRTFAFAGLVTKFDRTSAVAAKVTASCTIKISGAITES
jgi:hypothetical protein